MGKSLSKKTGKDVDNISNHKDKMVTMRFCQNEHTAIKKKAEEAKMSFTEFVTAAALNKSIVIINGLDELLWEQRAIGRNLNQITTLCNMGKIHALDLGEVKIAFIAITGKLTELLKRRT